MVKIKKKIQVFQVAKMSPLKNKNTFSLLLFHSLHVQVMNYFLFSFIIYGLLEKCKLCQSCKIYGEKMYQKCYTLLGKLDKLKLHNFC